MQIIKSPNLESKVSNLFFVIFIATLIATALFSFKLFLLAQTLTHAQNEKLVSNKIVNEDTPTPAPSETKVLPTSKQTQAVKSAKDTTPWGVAEKIDGTTWTMKVGQDNIMAEPAHIFEALNSYRQRKGSGALSWDDRLAEFAKMRTETFNSVGKLDGHSGFQDYLKNEENIKALGFYGLGENSSYGFQMEAVHLIEWVFAGDPPHDNNQLDPTWSHVGIGVSGTAADLIFGKNKI